MARILMQNKNEGWDKHPYVLEYMNNHPPEEEVKIKPKKKKK